jgi:pyruvate/2-oxoglutarate dehydrogenase complex dihydrolipoamide dehydrogenase (E3) component
VSRFLLRDYVQTRFGERLTAINAGIEKDGAFYLFTLRLVPLFPFFVINLVMGLTPIRTWVFYLVSQVGMFAGTVVYVNAGTQLGQIETPGDILSWPLVLSFTLLGIFPLLAKWAVAAIKKHQILRAWPKPAKFDYNLVVIGAGSAGLVSAYIAATVKARVALIEKHQMGGDCLNTGCVPSKALLRSARLLANARRATDFGFKRADIEFDFADVMQRIQDVIKRIEPHDSVERYTSLGVECISGEAHITSPYSVEVNGRTLTTRGIVVASGGAPFVPPIEGLEQIEYYTSDTIWSLRELPAQMVVLGGGPIGSELTQAFARFGAAVTQVEMMPRILLREDVEVAQLVRERFEAEGVTVLTDHRAARVEVDGAEKTLVCEHGGHEVRVPFDVLLVAVGRRAHTEGLGLQSLGIGLTRQGTVETDEYLQTRYPTIYCAGDVAGPYQFTHTAAHQAWFASVNALFGSFKRFKADYRVVPWATFTDPEVARVGLNELSAQELGVDYEVTRYGIDDLDRAIADSEAEGFVKVLTRPGSDKLLGATIVASHSGELIGEFIAAMKHGYGLNKILGTIHIYPTFSEANKYLAGEWKRAHAPARVLDWLGRYHAWRRG